MAGVNRVRAERLEQAAYTIEPGMNKRFELYWLRESGSDWGTPVDAEDLDTAIRERVLKLAGDHSGNNPGPLHLHLPFLDRRESRRRAEVLRGLTLVREGGEIRSV